MFWIFRKEGKTAEIINTTAQFFLCVALMPFFKLCSHMRVQGKKNIQHAERLRKDGRGVIFAMNHVTQLDVIIVVASVIFKMSPIVPIHYVSLEKAGYSHFSGLKKYFWGGWLFTLLGAYPVYRGKKNYGESLKNHIELLLAGKSVGIFPTGRMNKTAEWMNDHAHGGVAYLAESTRSPIVPVRIAGFEGFTVKRFLKGDFRLKVIFGEPLSFKDFKKNSDDTQDKYNQVASAVVQHIAALS